LKSSSRTLFAATGIAYAAAILTILDSALPAIIDATTGYQRFAVPVSVLGVAWGMLVAICGLLLQYGPEQRYIGGAGLIALSFVILFRSAYPETVNIVSFVLCLVAGLLGGTWKPKISSPSEA
jgi:hypothetical protein